LREARDPLANWLDEIKGSTITQHSMEEQAKSRAGRGRDYERHQQDSLGEHSSSACGRSLFSYESHAGQLLKFCFSELFASYVQ